MGRISTLYLISLATFCSAAIAEDFCSRTRPEPQLFWKASKLSGSSSAEKRQLTGKVFGYGRVRVKVLASPSGTEGASERELWSKTLVLDPAGEKAPFSRELILPRGSRLTLVAENIGSFSGYCISKEAQAKQQSELEQLKKDFAAGDDDADVSVSGPGTWY